MGYHHIAAVLHTYRNQTHGRTTQLLNLDLELLIKPHWQGRFEILFDWWCPWNWTFIFQVCASFTNSLRPAWVLGLIFNVRPVKIYNSQILSPLMNCLGRFQINNSLNFVWKTLSFCFAGDEFKKDYVEYLISHTINFNAGDLLWCFCRSSFSYRPV